MGMVRWEVFQKISADTSATHKSSEVHNKRHYGCCNMRCTQVVTPLSSCWGIIQWCLGKRSHFHSSQANSFQLSLCCFSVGNIERLFFSRLCDRYRDWEFIGWQATVLWIKLGFYVFLCTWSHLPLLLPLESVLSWQKVVKFTILTGNCLLS